ncbi:MAG: acylphosphatase [Dehalococcoidales bacterium]|jgi:acylphosphatase|nr:acylphosphatase [Dehalococcoidales bacterium]MDD3265110.1 acylphosphatase [Dehalococcoidales bacterium]MDD4322597.1 acylphosphatase [Dehalococcoidales bacterium]MDD4794163.1 acylphosphatase [Dehalococcoidales bacterium]MDD5122500.1 acylphosphatase [Dehalococcoidales bacterium]
MAHNPAQPGENQTVTARILISGRVQGVSFRRFAASWAAKTGVCGFVRNLSDGRSLEAIAQGSPSSVHGFFKLLEKGHPGALIEKASLKELDTGHYYQGFEIR